MIKGNAGGAGRHAGEMRQVRKGDDQVQGSAGGATEAQAAKLSRAQLGRAAAEDRLTKPSRLKNMHMPECSEAEAGQDAVDISLPQGTPPYIPALSSHTVHTSHQRPTHAVLLWPPSHTTVQQVVHSGPASRERREALSHWLFDDSEPVDRTTFWANDGGTRGDFPSSHATGAVKRHPNHYTCPTQPLFSFSPRRDVACDAAGT